MSQIWRNPLHNPDKADCCGAFYVQLDQLENASEEFLQANRNYAEASRDIKALQAGRQAATRG